MDLFLCILVSLIVGYRLGWVGREESAKRFLLKYMQEVGEEQEDEEEDSPDLLPIIIEKHEEGFFAYIREDNSFAAHGKTQEDLEDRLLARYPGRRFAIDPDNLEEVGYKIYE